MSSSGKARSPTYQGADIARLSRDVKQIYSLIRANHAPSQSVSPFITGTKPASVPQGYSALRTAGDSMIGPFALNPVAYHATIDGGSKGHINVGSTFAYSSNVIVDLSATSSGHLSYIDGASFDGQLLFFHVISGQTLVLQTDGNIVPFSSGFSVVGTAIAIFMFDSTLSPNGNQGGWVQLTSGSSSGGGAGTNWSNITIDVSKDMLQFQLKNLDLITFNGANTEIIDGIAGQGMFFSLPATEKYSFQIAGTEVIKLIDTPNFRLDMLQHAIINALDLRFGTTAGSISATVPMFTVNAGGDIQANVPSGGTYRLYVNNVEKWDIDASQISGPNLILSQALFLNNSSIDPSVNGEFRLNSTDVKVWSGGALRNLSNIGTAAAGANVFLSNLSSPTAVNQDLVPSVDVTSNLGSSSKRWNAIWALQIGSTTPRFINLLPATAGIEYLVDTGERHSFKIAGSEVMHINAADGMKMFSTSINLNTNNLTNANLLNFKSTGSACEFGTSGDGLVIDVKTNGFESHTLSNSINGTTTPITPNNGVLEVNGSGHQTYSGTVVIPSYKTVNTSVSIVNGNPIGGYYFDAFNSGAIRKTFATVYSVADTITAGSEFGTIRFQTINGGSGLVDVAKINATDGVAPFTNAGQTLGSSSFGWKYLYLGNSALDPTTAGQFSRNGVDVKVFTGGFVRNLSGLPTAGAANVFLSNLTSPVAVNQDLLPDASNTRSLGNATNRWLNMISSTIGLYTSGGVNYASFNSSAINFALQGKDGLSPAFTAADTTIDGTLLINSSSNPTLNINTIGVAPTYYSEGGHLFQGTSHANRLFIGTFVQPYVDVIPVFNGTQNLGNASSQWASISVNSIQEVTDIFPTNSSPSCFKLSTSPVQFGLVRAYIGATPTTANIPSGYWTVVRDTVNGSTKLYYNDGGVLRTVQLF